MATNPPFLAVYSGADVLAYRRCVYALLDPRQPEHVMYVGKTTQCALTRLDGHIWDAQQGRVQTPCCRWIASLLSFAILPSIAVLEVVPPGEDLEGTEQEWIRRYKRLGQAALNRQMRLRAQFEEELAATPQVIR